MEPQQILHILVHSNDMAQRNNAESQLNAALSHNLATFLHAMAMELARDGGDPEVRTLAALNLKNAISSDRDFAAHQEKALQWLHIGANERGVIKNLLLQSLHCPDPQPRTSAATCVATVGSIELQHGEWNDLIETLLGYSKMDNLSLRYATLETLGFLCEAIRNRNAIPSQQADSILNAIATGLGGDAPLEIRYVAIAALRNSINFISKNFEDQGERNSIMQVVCDSVIAPDPKVQEEAFMCLVVIASSYYEVLPDYMARIYELTIGAMGTATDKVAMQAIEFWSTICDEEMDILDEIQSLPATEQCTLVCHNFVEAALQKPEFIPSLTGILTRQEESIESDTWNPAMAAGACLALVAGTVGDAVVPAVMPFVYANVSHQNWRNREAAALAFGSILDGPAGDDISGIMNDAIPEFIKHMDDESVQVKDTTAWTLGRIVQFHSDTIDRHLHSLVNVMGNSLKDEPRVATNASWTLHNIAEAYRDHCQEKSSPLFPYFVDVMRALMFTSDREDADECNLRVSAYEAMNATILSAPRDCMSSMSELLPVFLDRLEATFSGDVDQSERVELHAYICSVLTALTQRLPATIVKQESHRMMNLYFEVFNSRNNTVHEEALSAVSMLAQVLEQNFQQYMAKFHDYLCVGLRNYQEEAVCLIAIATVGDVARAIGTNLVPHCDDILSIMYENLKVPHLSKKLKVHTLACFGDVALAIGGHFTNYLNYIIEVLQDASQATVDRENEDMLEYLNRLRESVFDAYTSIIQGLVADKQTRVFLPYLEHLLGFIRYVWNDSTKDAAVVRCIIGILGDIAIGMGGLDVEIKNRLNSPFVESILREGFGSNKKSVRELAQWSKMQIANIKAM